LELVDDSVESEGVVDSFEAAAIERRILKKFTLDPELETLRPFPNVETGKWQVSTKGGVMPKWGRSGPELFYVTADREMVAASIVTDPSVAVARQTILFALPPAILAPLTEHYTVYDVSRDDRRFVMARR